MAYRSFKVTGKHHLLPIHGFALTKEIERTITTNWGDHCRVCLFSHAPTANEAINRYNGQAYRVLTGCRRAVPNVALDVLILSAEFGLIEPDTPIPWYDRRVTTARAAELCDSVSAGLRERLEWGRYDQTLFCGGADHPERYATWYVEIAGRRVAPKWLVSVLACLPPSAFVTAEARRVLEQPGLEMHALNH